MTWHAKEVVRSILYIGDPDLAGEFVTQLAGDVQDDSCPPEVRSLGRNIVRWRDQIVAWLLPEPARAPPAHRPNSVRRGLGGLHARRQHSTVDDWLKASSSSPSSTPTASIPTSDHRTRHHTELDRPSGRRRVVPEQLPVQERAQLERALDTLVPTVLGADVEHGA
jgi:hypothetical protein